MQLSLSPATSLQQTYKIHRNFYRIFLQKLPRNQSFWTATISKKGHEILEGLKFTPGGVENEFVATFAESPEFEAGRD